MIEESNWWAIGVRRLSLAVLYVVIILLVIYTVTRLQIISDRTSELNRADLELQQMQAMNESNLKTLSERLDTLERVLFGDVVEKLRKTTVPPVTSDVQLWQKNRDRELRERIQKLEQWRQQQERER